MVTTRAVEAGAADDHAASKQLAHRFRPAAILDVEGQERVAFLHGQLTQDVRGMTVGQVLPAAGLTPKGKLLFLARLVGLPDCLRLLLPASSRTGVLEHLQKYAVFQRVSVVDRSDVLSRIGLYGPEAAAAEPPGNAMLLPGEGEFAAEIVAEGHARLEVERWLLERGSRRISDEDAEALRVEAGRPRFGQDADESYLADEVGVNAAISTTKGCYVGQEIVARMRTYGSVNRRLVGFRFPEGKIESGSLCSSCPRRRSPAKIEQGRVTSSVISPAPGTDRPRLRVPRRACRRTSRLRGRRHPSRPLVDGTSLLRDRREIRAR